MASTTSTNDVAKDAAAAGCPDRTVFLADVQTAGRGRLGRVWQAGPDSSLLFSLVLRKPIPPIYLTALCSVSVVEAIRSVALLEAKIKWPNDVMIGERKLCGILTEVVARGQSSATIVGIGINVNVDLAQSALPPSATSLSEECGALLPRDALLNAILDEVERNLAESGPKAVFERWERLLWRRHQRVQFDQDGSIIEGVVEGLTDQGALRLTTADGSTKVFQVGDLLI